MAANCWSRTSWTSRSWTVCSRSQNKADTPSRIMAKNSVYPAVSRKRRPRVMRRSSPVRFTSHLPVGGLGGLLCRFFRGVDQVPDAAHGLDQLLREPVVDLAAEMADVNIDDVGETIVIHVPDVLDDHRAAERAAAIAHHLFEDDECVW